ncbi:MAG: hypothetical protein JWP89_3860 [Schlesneria sp.]|nr:hypothetical protein [Schlesneria sp.]
MHRDTGVDAETANFAKPLKRPCPEYPCSMMFGFHRIAAIDAAMHEKGGIVAPRSLESVESDDSFT